MNAGTPWLAGSAACGVVFYAFISWQAWQAVSPAALADAIASSDCVKVDMVKAIGRAQVVTNQMLDTVKKSCEAIKEEQEILKEQKSVLEEPNPFLKKPNR